MPRITVFHTSDMHNKLTPALADRLRELRQAHPGSMVLDSGDAIWAGNIVWRPGGEPILDVMTAVPYDAMCLGNREFHFLGIAMNSKTARAKFPILSANLRPANSSKPLRAKPYEILERGGVRVGVLGLSVPCITERMLVKRVSDHYFEQPISAAERIVPELRDRCDLLIALTHIGIKRDRELAESVRGINLILGGHTHAITAEPEQVGDTHILHHGSFAHYVGRVDVEIDSGSVVVKNELIPLAKA